MAQDIRVASVTLSLEDEGTGPVVVFIHGWCCSGRFFQRQLPYFARAHRVIIPDLRGHGRSEKTLGGHTLPQYAADLHIALRATFSRAARVGGLVDGRGGGVGVPPCLRSWERRWLGDSGPVALRFRLGRL